MKRLINNAIYLSIISIGLSVSCSSPNVGNQNQIPPTKDSASAKSSPSPTSQLFQMLERSSFIIRQFSDEPISLLDIRLSKPNNPTDSDLILEIQNVSNKDIEKVGYGMGTDERCGDFMYAPIPSPNIEYGNPKEPVIHPQDKAIIQTSKDEWLKKLLNPKTYASCPEGSKKPILALADVQFTDGSKWQPKPAK